MQPDQLQKAYDGGSFRLRVRRQIFVPSNIGTNTFVLDTASFLSLLTLLVFLVRVFSRVIRSNTVQRVTVGADPSLARAFVKLGDDKGKRQEFVKVKKHKLESAMKSDKFKTRLKRNRRSNDRRSIDQVSDKSINLLFRGDIARPVISRDTIDNVETVLAGLDKSKFESQFHKQKTTTTWTQSALLFARKLVLLFKQSEPLDRRKRSGEFVRESGRQFVQRPLPPIVQQQGGIAGVDYDTIYLSIGVAATALFIIETLYKAYQLYTDNNGRSVGGSYSVLETMSEGWLARPGQGQGQARIGWLEANSEHG